MLNSSTHDLYYTCQQFLQASAQQRLLELQAVGLGRYADFLTQMRCNEANVLCVMRFFQNPRRVKFPQLQGADLSNLILNGVNLIRGDLSGANLYSSSLINADLIFANFSTANLKNANLMGATLNETVWKDTLLDGCNFHQSIGLTRAQKEDLIKHGARFD